MKNPKQYINGNIEQPKDLSRAKEMLIKAGIYQTISNWAPYFPNKQSRVKKVIKTFIIEDIEFTLIETATMSWSFDSMSVSRPCVQQEILFQTI